MSFDLTKWALRGRLPLKTNEKLALAIFACHANEKGVTFVSHGIVAKLAGIKRRETMGDITDKLKDLKLLVPTGAKVGGTKRVVEYQLNTYAIELAYTPKNEGIKPRVNGHKKRTISPTLEGGNGTENVTLNGTENVTLNGHKNRTQKKPYKKPYKKPQTENLSLEKNLQVKTDGMAMDEWLIKFPHLATLKENDRLYGIGKRGGFNQAQVTGFWMDFKRNNKGTGELSTNWLENFETWLIKHVEMYGRNG